MIKIRKPTTGDINELENLFLFTRKNTFKLRESENFQIGDYIKSVEEDDVWIAEENNIIVGFVSIYTQDNFLHNLFVHPKHQGKGIGKKLLQIAEQNLKKPMRLKVAIDNSKACDFYDKYEWRKISIHCNSDEPYILMEKI